VDLPVSYWLVMPAAGSGRRFRERGAASAAEVPKQYAPLLGRTVIEWALAPFAADPRCAALAVALAPDDRHWRTIATRAGAEKEVILAPGGAERAHSVRSGLAALCDRAAGEDWVLVHDAARPCLARADLDRLLAEGGRHPVGAVLAAPVADTVKACAENGAIERTVDRAGLWRALTPQMFRYGALCAALDAAIGAGRSPTDEAQALEWTGAQPLAVRGSPSNLKITTTADLAVAAALLGEAEGGGAMQDSGATRAAGATHTGAERAVGAARIGSGFDVHAFGPGDSVMLGGVRIAHTQGVLAHSDGDVILHALCDALLGAGGLGDIGQHFRDDDPRWRGAPSSGFVRAVLEMLAARGLGVVNADITLLAEAPRLAKHRDAIRARVAELIEVPPERVNIKATTTEGLGFLGRREGIAAQAVVLVAPR
jgi:2-C-methyl-D-erythritol 4-phosphate cytidylyltransferase / 2-C-methyl-D-erythritol 2,4-cyclodiphosphate synthase